MDMKKLFWLSLLLAAGAWQGVCRGYLDPNRPLPAHPRLLLSRGAEEPLLGRIGQDSLWSHLHASILEESDRIAAQPPVTYRVEGNRLLATSREALRRIFFLAYSCRMTGRGEYARRAEAEMLAAAAFPDWNPGHFLDVAEMTLAMAIGYDWLQDRLPVTSREAIAEAIVEKGLKPARNERNTWFYGAANNWNQVCNAGLTYGALAVFERESALATALIDKAVETLPTAMKTYAPDGAYPEGIGYWDYGTSFNVLLLDALERCLGSDFGLSEMPGFLQTGRYAQHMITPTGNAFCYADCEPRLGFFPAPFWFYRKSPDPALVRAQRQALGRDRDKRFLENRLLPLALLWGAASGPQQQPETSGKWFWVGQGSNPVCAMRTAWNDPDALFVGFKAGSPSTNHAHMDVGSFCVEANGIRWALDLGMEPYHGVEQAGVDLWNGTQESQRWDVFRLNNFAHNTLTFNNRKQQVAGHCRIDSCGAEPERMYAVSDLTPVCPPWVKESARAVALAERSYVVVQDRITTGRRFTRMRWNMMTEADTVTELGNDSYLLKKGPERLYLRIETPVGIEVYHRPATPSNSYDSDNPGVFMFGFEAELPLATPSRFPVFLMPDEMRDCDSWRDLL